MSLRRTVLGALFVAGALAFACAPAGASGGGGASFCSYSGAPVGGAPQTFGNAGELISWYAQHVGNSATNNPSGVVAGACNPSPSGP